MFQEMYVTEDFTQRMKVLFVYVQEQHHVLHCQDYVDTLEIMTKTIRCEGISLLLRDLAVRATYPGQIVITLKSTKMDL